MDSITRHKQQSAGAVQRPFTAVLASNGVFRKAMDTQFIIIVDKDTMVSIIYPKCDDAVVHQIAEIYYGIHTQNSPVVYYNQVSPYATKVSQGKQAAINNILAFFYLFVFKFFLSLLLVF